MLVVAASGAASAQELDGGIDVRLSAEAVNNPYLETGDTDVTGAVSAEVRPWLGQQTEVTSFNLAAVVQARQFVEDYDLEDNYGASATLTHRASERVTLTGRADAYSSAARLSSVFPGLNPNPDTPVPPLDPGVDDDPTLLGQRGRTIALSAGVGAQYAIDERNSVAIDLDLQDLGFTHANSRDYRTYGIAAQLTQVANPTTTVGATFSLRNTDYAEPTARDARVVVVMGSVSHRLDERWTLEASAGASATRIEAAGPIPRSDSTAIAASMSLCQRQERGTLCLDYGRQPEPTGAGGVRNSDTARLNYNLQWSERNRLAVAASYSRSGRAIGSASVVPAVEFLSVRATLERAFNKRVSGFVTASTTRVYRPDLSVEPNVNVGLGISVLLGRRR